MKKKIVAGVVAIILFISSAIVYLSVQAAHRLRELRRAVSASSGVPSSSDLSAARRTVEEAVQELRRPAFRLIAAIPLIGDSVDALNTIGNGLDGLLMGAGEVATRLDALEEKRILQGGRLRVELISGMESSLVDQSERLMRFRRVLIGERTPWLLPPVSGVVEELISLSEKLGLQARLAADLVHLSPHIAGVHQKRRYLVLLLNNAELRGAGGIPSAIGTMVMDRARPTLGRFYLPQELRGERPYTRVPAPKTFVRRFGRYAADTSFWVNTTMSVNIPQVARVAGRLFRAATGVATDGVILVDPRGLAALLPPDALVNVPTTDRTLTPDALPHYIYWHAYEELGGTDPVRKKILMALGRRVFQTVIEDRAEGSPDLGRIAKAISGGHLRFISFHEDEQKALAETGVAGELPPRGEDLVLVARQNFGGDKLDYWTSEHIAHRCRIQPHRARCETRAEVANRVPPGLPRFIARPGHSPDRSYGVVKRFLEIFVPSGAQITEVELNGHPARFHREREDPHTVVGIDLEIEPGESVASVVRYELELTNSDYSLAVIPQPLAHDSQVEIELDLPDGWVVHSEAVTEGPFHYSGSLDRTLKLTATPGVRSGIARWWRRLPGV